MNIPKEDLAILNAAAPYINANLFNASDLVDIYQRELARSSDIDIEVEKVEVLPQIVCSLLQDNPLVLRMIGQNVDSEFFKTS